MKCNGIRDGYRGPSGFRYAASGLRSLSTERTRRKGFARTEEIVILARKLLRVAFAVWTSGNQFDPGKLGFVACQKP